MENINNIITPVTPIQPIETPTPKSNLFKYLFIICFIVLLASVIYSFFIIKNLNSKLETKQDITEVTPTAIPTEEVDEVTPTITPITKVDQTANWKTYTDRNSIFTLKYPSTVVLDYDLNKLNSGIPQLTLDISVRKIAEIEDDSYGGGSEIIKKNKDILEKGQPFSIYGLKPSIKVVKLTNKINAQMRMQLTVAEDCDLALIREMVFYTGDYEIIINYVYRDINVESKIPSKYLTIDKAKCGDNKMWKSQEEFYKDISNNQLENKTLQNWFNDFDKIVSTIKFN